MKNTFLFQLCCICMLVLIMAGCKIKRPSAVLPESNMEELLYDYHIAKAMGNNLPYNDNYKKALYMEAVFKKHGTTQAVFDSSMVWYTRNTELLSKIYERLNKRLQAQQNEINHLIAIRDKKPKTTSAGDSIDVWSWQRLVQLTGVPLNNKLTFVLPSDSNFKKRDTILWEVRYRFLERIPDSTKAAIMAMQIVYENDSIINQTKKIYNSGIEHIRLQSDTLGAIKEVRGFIYYPGSKLANTLLADRIALTRYHSTDTLSAAKDSLKTAALKADSIKKATEAKEPVKTDTVKPDVQHRLSPEEMNRRRTNSKVRTIRREQVQRINDPILKPERRR